MRKATKQIKENAVDSKANLKLVFRRKQALLVKNALERAMYYLPDDMPREEMKNEAFALMVYIFERCATENEYLTGRYIRSYESIFLKF